MSMKLFQGIFLTMTSYIALLMMIMMKQSMVTTAYIQPLSTHRTPIPTTSHHYLLPTRAKKTVSSQQWLYPNAHTQGYSVTSITSRYNQLTSLYSSSISSNDNNNNDNENKQSSSSNQKSLSKRLKKIFGFGNNTGENDGLSTKEKLAKMGLSALLSYGFISNVFVSITVSLAWFTHAKKTGLSPLAPGQWKQFTAIYAGFYIFNNIIRPLRFGISVAVSKYFDLALQKIQTKFNVSKSVAIGILVFLANICGTTSLMAMGISLASLAAGVSVFPPKV